MNELLDHLLLHSDDPLIRLICQKVDNDIYSLRVKLIDAGMNPCDNSFWYDGDVLDPAEYIETLKSEYQHLVEELDSVRERADAFEIEANKLRTRTVKQMLDELIAQNDNLRHEAKRATMAESAARKEAERQKEMADAWGMINR